MSADQVVCSGRGRLGGIYPGQVTSEEVTGEPNQDLSHEKRQITCMGEFQVGC
jgi:hypothetical protein